MHRRSFFQGVAAAGVAGTLAGCTSLFLQPNRVDYPDPGTQGLLFEDRYFDSPDGLRLHAWFLPAQDEDGRTQTPRAVLVHAHGNAQNLGAHSRLVWWLSREGYAVLAFDYRGYGRSEGQAELAGAHLDTAAAIAEAAQLGGREHGIIVYGQSLGGAVVAETVAGLAEDQRATITGVILESVFTDYHHLARDITSRSLLTWPLQYPVSWLTRTPYSPFEAMPELSPIPVLVLVNGRDIVVPPEQTRALYDAAQPPRKLLESPETGHIQFVSKKENAMDLLAWLDDVAMASSGRERD